MLQVAKETEGKGFFIRLNHGAIIRTGITCKNIEFGIALKWSATRYEQKTEIVLVTRPRTC